jgi:hypothetical protein
MTPKKLISLMVKGKNNEEQVDVSQDMKSNVQPSQNTMITW